MRKVYEGSDSTISENGVIGGSMELEWEVSPVLNSDCNGLLWLVLLVLGLLLNLNDRSVVGRCGYGGNLGMQMWGALFNLYSTARDAYTYAC